MNGIACDTTKEFNDIEARIYKAMCKSIEGYEESTERWATPDHVIKGKTLLLFDSSPAHAKVIQSVLTKAEKARVIDCLPELKKLEVND